jgi:hypothetical protein
MVGAAAAMHCTVAAPGKVRPLAPLQIVEIAAAQVCTATLKTAVAEQSTSHKIDAADNLPDGGHEDPLSQLSIVVDNPSRAVY